MENEFIYLEDLSVGQTFTAGPVTLTQEEIIAFATSFDPQDFHTDPGKAKDTFFGQLVASGWHTAAVAMRMLVDAVPKMKGGMVGRAIEKMNWPRAVLPGDTLSLRVEILDLRTSERTPERGMARTRNIVVNQKGETVMDMEVVIFVPRRLSSKA